MGNDGYEYYKQTPLTLFLEAVKGRSFKKTEVGFLLDTDRKIPNETRVGLIPEQIKLLKDGLEVCSLNLIPYVVEAAGIWAGHSDADYKQVGAQIVTLDELKTLKDIDVVHALKEPTEHEADIPGPVMRIGAVHLVSRPIGIRAMIKKKNFSALFDGSTVGACSYLISGSDKTPVVASMSRIAAEITSEKLVLLHGEDLKNEKIIVVGSGVVGLTVIHGLKDKVGELVVIESNANVRNHLKWLLRTLGFYEFTIAEKLSQAMLTQAMGIIFSQRDRSKAAPLICGIQYPNLPDVTAMKQGALIVDIAIDQGGSLAWHEIKQEDDVPKRIEIYKRTLKNYCYYAEPNMPFERPRKASEKHGDAVLPYIMALLILSAEHGHPAAATESILANNIQSFDEDSPPPPTDFFQCIVQDLRNGLALAIKDGQLLIEDPDINANPELLTWIKSCQ